MLCKSCSLKSILSSAMIPGLKIIRISSEHYSTGIFPNVFSSFGHSSHFTRTSILNRSASQTRKVAEYTARCTTPTGGGMHKISFRLERQLCQSFAHLTRLTWPIFLVISVPGRCISRMVIFEKISAGHLKSAPGF